MTRKPVSPPLPAARLGTSRAVARGGARARAALGVAQICLLGLGCAGSAPERAEPASLARNSFGALNFTLESRPIAAQVDLLRDNGYEHLSFWGPQLGIPVEVYWAEERIAAGRFPVTGVLYSVNLAAGYDPVAITQLLDELQGKRAALWLLLEGEAEREQWVSIVSEVSELADERELRVVLYPHQGTAIVDAESANELRLAVRRANVSISLHLCHELKAGNRDRLAEVIDNVAENVAIATINGADQDIDTQTNDWSRTIMPLDRGDFDVQERYLRPLITAGYRGPIVLHTFGIDEPPEEHYQRSARRWRSMQSALAAP